MKLIAICCLTFIVAIQGIQGQRPHTNNPYLQQHYDNQNHNNNQPHNNNQQNNYNGFQHNEWVCIQPSTQIRVNIKDPIPRSECPAFNSQFPTSGQTQQQPQQPPKHQNPFLPQTGYNQPMKIMDPTQNVKGDPVTGEGLIDIK